MSNDYLYVALRNKTDGALWAALRGRGFYNADFELGTKAELKELIDMNDHIDSYKSTAADEIQQRSAFIS